MAGKGLYGVFASKCVKNQGVTTGYDGNVIMIGKAISAEFTPKVPSDNPLYANNGISENDNSSGSGGTLALVIDRMTLDTAAALYGTTVEDVTVQVGEETISGKEISYRGLEVSKPHGAAYIKLNQEDGENFHEVLFYRESTFTRPNDSAQTMGENVEWQTPTINGNVMGMQGDGSQPWYRVSRWPSQEAAIYYIYQLFGAEATPDQIQQAMNNLQSGDDEVGV